MSEHKEKDKKYRCPRRDDRGEYKVTPPMLADTYGERLREEMEETISAVVLAETYPDMLNYRKAEDDEDCEDEEE